MKTVVLVLVLVCVECCRGGLLSWLFKSKNKTQSSEQTPPAASTPEVSEDVALSPKIPFEIKSSDEKFLAEAAAYTSLKLSDLDMCHHKVILSLQKSCAELTEEDLSRVSVNLLNCQSLAEGRQIFPCTSDMSLSACTRDMDPNFWNAYHIVSNRARAVCYASRQDQFGAQTQMAVNLLMHSAQQQIKTMTDLHDGQEALGKATSETLESLSSGHQHLKQQQEQLSEAHQAVHSFISSSLRDLSREKKLISSGQRELALITDTIRRKLDEAKAQLSSQEASQREAHLHILQDLATIQDSAMRVWQKLDGSTQKILQAHEETVQQYGQLTDNVVRLNHTVHHLLGVLQATRRGVEERLSWLGTLVGDTDHTLHRLYRCLLHAGYFFIAMLSASFLKVPYLSRLVLVVLVPLNAVSEVKHDTSLQFSTLTTILTLCTFVNVALSVLWSSTHKHKPQYISSPLRCPPVKQQSEGEGPPLPSPLFTTAEATQEQGVSFAFGVGSSDGCGEAQHSTSLCDDGPHTTAGGDYSSDDEAPTPVSPLRGSFLRHRIFNRAKAFGSTQSLDSVEEVEERREEDLHNDTAAPYSPSQAEKTLSSVRRHLLDQLKVSGPSCLAHNLSLDGRLHSSMKDTPASSRSGTPSRSSSMTPKKLCSSLCRNGQLCRNTAQGDTLYCHLHRRSRDSTPQSTRCSRRSTPLSF